MSYKQKFGISPIKKKDPDPLKVSKKKYIDVDVQGGDDKMYSIRVTENSSYARLAKKMGSVPKSFRNVSFTSKTDPAASGISEKERKKRESAYLRSVGR